MSTTPDTLLRQWQTLRLIPRHPHKVTARDIQEKLQQEGQAVSKRTVERDLQALSEIFPLVADEREKPFGWCWARDAAAFDLPGMSASEALTMQMVKLHLQGIMPASVLEQLQPYFSMAEQRLSSPGRKGRSWADKVRVVPPTQQLLPPKLNPAARDVVYEALLQGRQLAITYLKRGETEPVEYTLHPLAIVQRGPIIYIVCTIKDYQDIRLLALHRVQSAEMLSTSAKKPAGFDIDAYLASGALGFGNGKQIRLEAVFNREAGLHLYETPLNEDQELTELEDGRIRVVATVADTPQLRWWLRGFGEGVDVSYLVSS